MPLTFAAPARAGYLILAGIRGNALQEIASTSANELTWTSPLLTSGSYELEVVALNGTGTSPPSNRVSWSVGETTIPGPPTRFAATMTTRFDSRGLPRRTAPPPRPT